MKTNNDMNSMSVLVRLAEMERERYVSTGDYSVTSLITPPRIVRLQKRYADQVPLDVTAMIPGMTGTAVHEYAEKYLLQWITKHKYEDYVLEEELHTNQLDRRITGRYDIRDGVHLYDIKNIKTWKLIFDPTFEEFHQQQNLYAYLLHLQGLDLETINILAFYKDWQEGNALRDRSYPQSPVVEYELDMWSWDRTEQFMLNRLNEHIQCEEIADENLPVCSRDDRWERHRGGGDIHYGILKNRKAKRATKVVKGGSLDDAIGIANTLKGMTKDSVIEVRFALPKRCVSYCSINGYCNWYQEWCKKPKNKKGTFNEYVNFKV